MKNKFLLAGLFAAFVAFSTTVEAVPITGSVNFDGGTITYTSTAITSFGGSTVVNNNFGLQPTGSFAGTGNTPVNFVASGFTFSPALLPNPVALWNFSFGGNTYSFSLTSITFSSTAGGSLVLNGGGVLSISGGTYDNTAASWTLSSTGSGPTTFGFVAGDAAVPDGGTTAILLGSALTSLGLVRKKLLAK